MSPPTAPARLHPMVPLAVSLLGMAVSWTSPRTAAAGPPPPEVCAPLQQSRRLTAAATPPPAAGSGPERPGPVSPATTAPHSDYRHRLSPTPHGWVHRRHWCVWVEPSGTAAPPTPWELRWTRAVGAALQQWGKVLSITRVEDPSRAQVRLHRRRPPLRTEGGKWRASHGRAELHLLEVQRQGEWRPEPLVEVSIGPGQHERGIQATALHELGHAFGLWGHSDKAEDVMAAIPGATPVLTLSPRDRGTLRWLQNQPSLFSP